MFEAAHNNSNHVRLYAEDVDLRAQWLGHFPRAFKHSALISLAFYLDRELMAVARNNGVLEPQQRENVRMTTMVRHVRQHPHVAAAGRAMPISPSSI